MFKVGANNTHGQGWIALRDIPSGTPIYDERARFQFPLTILDNPALVKKWFLKLSEEERASILALHGRNPLEKLHMNGMPLLDIKSDCYGTRRNGYLGIFLQCARLNHSCRPNVARAVGDDNVTSVVAQRNIHEGEEITISYLDDNFVDSTTRTSALQSKVVAGDLTWADGCQCSLCKAPVHELEGSNARRKELANLRDSLMRRQLALSRAFDILQLMAA